MIGNSAGTDDRVSPSDVSRRLLELLDSAPPAAQRAEDLLPLVYDELRILAHQRLAGDPAGASLQTTALVHEAYLRLVGDRDVSWVGKGHFFGAAAQAMRRILVERARRKKRARQAADQQVAELDQGMVVDGEAQIDIVALDEAIDRLAQFDARKHQVVMLRYFAGLTIEETANAMNLSPATVKTDWQFAKAWLHREMS